MEQKQAHFEKSTTPRLRDHAVDSLDRNLSAFSVMTLPLRFLRSLLGLRPYCCCDCVLVRVSTPPLLRF
jgi:hypothetical protein